MKTYHLLFSAIILILLSSCVRKIEDISQRYLLSAVVYDIPYYDRDGHYWGSSSDTLPDIMLVLDRNGDLDPSGYFYPTNALWDIESFPVRLTFLEPQPLNDSVYYIVYRELDNVRWNTFDGIPFEGLDYSQEDQIHVLDDQGKLLMILECEDRIVGE